MPGPPRRDDGARGLRADWRRFKSAVEQKDRAVQFLAMFIALVGILLFGPLIYSWGSPRAAVVAVMYVYALTPWLLDSWLRARANRRAALGMPARGAALGRRVRRLRAWVVVWFTPQAIIIATFEGLRGIVPVAG